MEEDTYEEESGIYPADATCDSGHVESSCESLNGSPEQRSCHGVGVGGGGGGYRSKSLSKMKVLVRSHALREATSPPPDPLLSPNEELIHVNGDQPRDADSHHSQTPNSSSKPKVKQVESSQCSMESTASFVSFSLSRDSSADLGSTNPYTYTDNTGVDLQHFIVETLHRNYKDRTTLLRIEQDMITLVKDPKRTYHRFPSMSSYHRMLVHRVAAYFGLEHNVDQSGSCVVVSKSQHTRLPDTPFKHYVRDDLILPEEPNRKVNIKREAVSFDEFRVSSARFRSPERRSKSFEDRGGDYNRGKMRMSHSQQSWNSSQDGGGAVNESSYASPSHKSSHEDVRLPRRYAQGILRNNRIPKVESFDSRELLCHYGSSLRPAVAKSYSFGGYTAPPVGEGVLVRGDSVPTGPTQNSPRLLSKQDSSSSSISVSRLSPTSSGYKSQQSQSVSAAPSPTPISSRTSSRHHPVSSHNSSLDSQPITSEWVPPKSDNPGTALLWAVTSLDAVPTGSVLINPHTGQPFYNQDGSVYRYDPGQPLPYQVENCTSCPVSNGIDDANGAQSTQTEVAQPYEGYEEGGINKTDNYDNSNTASIPVYAAWPANYYESVSTATPTPTTTPTPYAQSQPYYTELSTIPPGGYYLAPHTPATEEQLKTIAVPVAYGQGYVLYQACVTPSAESSGVENDLNPLLKNLSLRPLLPVSYPPAGTEMLPQQTDVNPVPVYSLPIRPNFVGKVQAGVNYRPTFPSNPAPVPSPASSVTNPPTLSNSFSPAVRVSSNGSQLIPSYSNGNMTSPYPVVYPLGNTTPAAHSNGQHYIASSVVHHFNNAQYVPASRPFLLGSPTSSRGRTPEREAAGNGDVTRVIHGSIPPGRFPFVYGSALGSPVLPGEIRSLPSSPAFFHRQFSLPTPTPPAVYTLRPRLQQQLTIGGPQMPHPSIPPTQQGHFSPSSRPPRMRRHSSRTNASGTGITPPASATPTQSCSTSPIQQQATSS